MKILVTGNGGREHGLAWRIAQSSGVERVFIAPGNAGTATEDKMENVDIDVMDFAAQIEFARSRDVDLTIIGPEAPLVAGVVDRFQAAGLTCLGPGKGAAQLEGSKSFTKDFLTRYGIPTARYGSFEDADLAVEFVKNMSTPVVIKADGLAAGKGVVIAHSHDDAEFTIVNMLSGNAFGEAGARVVIEEFLVGEEASFIVIADGKSFVPFASSQDHKAAYDDDKGPNTGGMGAYSPAPVVTADVHNRIIEQVIKPAIAGMFEDGHPYTGFLYAGLMIDDDGDPKVIEFNCRFGDPETQPVMMRMKSDLVQLCVAATKGNLKGKQIEFDDNVALTVVIASGGYPGNYATGCAIDGLDSIENGKVFHAGTKLEDGVVKTSGGRVLGVTALGRTVGEAQSAAYRLVNDISFEDMYFRTDIGYRAVAREESDN
ncbi:MAG: phosphoribosylamine--glycine ligase [Gammaproteobacteria bacterium]|nr:phosphoribosylamine--glycine ligase [Gammaproteobacteria bacterium]